MLHRFSGLPEFQCVSFSQWNILVTSTSKQIWINAPLSASSQPRSIESDQPKSPLQCLETKLLCPLFITGHEQHRVRFYNSLLFARKQMTGNYTFPHCLLFTSFSVNMVICLEKGGEIIPLWINRIKSKLFSHKSRLVPQAMHTPV